MNSSQPKRYNESYSSTLNQHKELIKKNVYARELEQKYHKIHHQRFKPNKLSHYSTIEEKPLWPIESSAFTEVLKSKLNNSTDSKLSKSQQYKHIFNKSLLKPFTSELPSLPKIDKARFWSPPKLNSPTSDFFLFTKTKQFGPKVKPVKYAHKDFY